MCQHNLPCSIVYAHCLLPGRAFASLYVLLFLEKEAEIGGREHDGVISKSVFCLDVTKDSSPMMKDTVEKIKKMIGKPRNYGKIFYLQPQ